MLEPAQRSMESSLTGLQNLLAPALLASSIFMFAGCSRDRDLIAPKSPAPPPPLTDPVTMVIPSSDKTFIAEDIANQDLLNHCAEVKVICERLLKMETSDKDRYLVVLNETAELLLRYKLKGTEFASQGLTHDTYRSLRHLTDVLKNTPFIYTNRIREPYIPNSNYELTLELRSNAELMIASLADRQ